MRITTITTTSTWDGVSLNWSQPALSNFGNRRITGINASAIWPNWLIWPIWPLCLSHFYFLIMLVFIFFTGTVVRKVSKIRYLTNYYYYYYITFIYVLVLDMIIIKCNISTEWDYLRIWYNKVQYLPWCYFVLDFYVRPPSLPLPPGSSGVYRDILMVWLKMSGQEKPSTRQ